MPLIYVPFSQKDNLLGLHICLRTRYSQSKVKVIFTILQFTTFIEWIEKENVEEADYFQPKHTDMQNGEGVLLGWCSKILEQ